MTFHLKLLLAMMGLVVGVTAATLFAAASQVRHSYERHFQESFRFQVDSFLEQREARLEPVKERVSAAAASTRLFAAMENAEQEHPDQHDIDDLYQNGLDQLLDVMDSLAGRSTEPHPFFFFLNNRGQILYPSDQIKLPFSLGGLHRIAGQVEAVGLAVAATNETQIGYLAPDDENGNATLREMMFTPVVDQVGGRRLGVLAVGFPLATVAGQSSLLSAIWVDNRLYSSSIPRSVLPEIERTVGSEVKRGAANRRDFVIQIGGAPHQVYYEALNTSPAFPTAYQLCVYSLAEATAENQRFSRRILVSGVVASLGALILSWRVSRSLAVPIEDLVARTAEIERGDYNTKVKVRGRDEFSRLGQAFNAMTEHIQASHAALEQRIAERTHELAERKRAEEALRKSEARLREAQRIAHLGNWEWNIPSNELHWSDEIYSIFGLAPREFGATYEAFLDRVHPADRSRVDQAVRESLEFGKPYGVEHRVVRPDGEHRVVREQGELFRDDGGKPVRMVGTVQDITEQKRIEAEFLRAQRMDGIGAIAGGMAHDLNNALSPILMGIQIIRNKVSEPDIQQMLSVMETNTYRGADMVRQVLTFARGRDGERELLDLGKLVREMENILRQTMPKSITVETLVPKDLWSVMGNATQLHQALLNLCVNARDAMPNGGRLTLATDNVELTAEEARDIPEAKPGHYVMLMVSDTGSGIPPEILPRIFEAFFTTKAPGKGTGLGLSTIARIVRGHGGCLSVKSEVGSGTSFDIYLPRAETAKATPQDAAGTAPATKAGRGELVLFVDDDRSVREMVTPALIENGYKVLGADNGVEALALLNQHANEVRVVIADISMPMMDGLELIEKLRARRRDLPVVLMSGTFDVKANPLPAGAAGFLSKPFRLEQILSVIAKALPAKARDV